jgi:cytidine deaminase
MDDKTLMQLAEKVRKTAYAPYSNFKVGCALLTKSGKVYTGINIENASFSPTNCAERTAFFKAISEGEREFEAIAICGGKNESADEICTPCGVCRQVMAEFCKGDFIVILGNVDKMQRHTLSSLLPLSFGLDKE